MSTNGETPESVCPPELSILRDECHSQVERDAVDRAYWSHASGDPETYPVKFAVLTAANARVLKAYPDRLTKILETETKNLAAAIRAEQEPIKEAAETFQRNSILAATLVQKIEKALDANTRQVIDERKISEREWEKRMGDLKRQSEELRSETSKLLEWKKDTITIWIVIAVFVSLFAGCFLTLGIQHLLTR